MALSLQRYTWADANSRITSLLKQRSRNQRERSIAIAINKVDHLPENLITEILSWLPVKDLLQYKTVNKSWYAIISSPDFIAKHLKNYYKNNDDWRGCLLVEHYVSHAELQLYELFVDETTRVLADEVLYSLPSYSSYICGPCDGLYYVYQYDSSERALWNPAINQFERLPSIVCKPDLPALFTYAANEVYGFGLDPVSGDYKVVVIKGYWTTSDDDYDDARHPPSVLVYSLKTNSWKYIGDLAKAYELDSNKCYIYANGCSYWFGTYEYTTEVIISFDFGTNAYKEIDFPDYTQPSSKCLGVYDDSLALFSVQESKVLDIWTWNVEGSSWTKTLTAGPFPDVRGPIGHWKDNLIILQCEDGLGLFDPETQEVKNLGFHNERGCEGVFAYMESLVSIKDKLEQPVEAEAEDSQA